MNIIMIVYKKFNYIQYGKTTNAKHLILNVVYLSFIYLVGKGVKTNDVIYPAKS